MPPRPPPELKSRNSKKGGKTAKKGWTFFGRAVIIQDMEHLRKLSPLFTAGIFLFAFLGGIFIIVDNKIEPVKANQVRFEQEVKRELKEIRAALFKLLQRSGGP